MTQLTPSDSDICIISAQVFSVSFVPALLVPVGKAVVEWTRIGLSWKRV